MSHKVNLYWNRCKTEVWGDLFTVDLANSHFDGLEGVFATWSGGASPAPLAVGHGNIREELEKLRFDSAMEQFRSIGVFVTWARANPALIEGIDCFLAQALQPKIDRAPAPAPIVEVNLPGRPEIQGIPPAQKEPTQPDQLWDDIVAKKTTPQQAAASITRTMAAAAPKPAVVTPAKPRRVSRLQTLFNEIIEKRGKEPKSSGFFGGAKPKDAQEGLINEIMQAILEEAVGSGASDIHIEPMETVTRVRMRVDGVLEEVLAFPHSLNLRLVSYIRVMANLDPEKSLGTAKPEDSRMNVRVADKEADLRLSTFPTQHGEKAVLRVIPRDIELPTLLQAGLLPESIKLVEDIARRPQGMIVVTGPTGSGKSTTIYTMLQLLNEPGRNIVTLEDPVEKKIPGLMQGMIQPKVGFTFSTGLRAILRQDPNVIMVGEIRDVETAEIAMSAALTGHMLLTTLHTNSALGAVTRLLDMGLEPFLVSSALTAVFAQRLARRLCTACREEGPITDAERAQIAELAQRGRVPVPALGATAFRPRGCKSCRETGYRGRLIIFESIIINPEIRQIILRKGGLDDLLKAALIGGKSEFLLADGLTKAAAGHTSLPEIARVVGAAD
jgi:type II secretory ATPase GspE/PulE/Tfp pilus assembly ATPase PilB-like protein